MLLKIKLYFFIWLAKLLHGYGKIKTKTLYAQAWHETGDFKSPVFIQNKNLFGMRHPSIRDTTSQGSNLNHAIYKNHYSAIHDYFKRQKYFKIRAVSDSQYMLDTVNSGYAEDTSYLTKWQKVIDTIKPPIHHNLFLAVVFFFASTVIFLIYKKTKKS